MIFKNLGVVGLGMMGGSLASSVKSRGIAECVTGFSRNPATLEKAKKKGIIDRYFIDFKRGLDDLDLLVVATPIESIRGYFIKIKESGRSSLLITDVASVKEQVVADAAEILGVQNNFVGSHPIAGSEKRGIDSVKDELFLNKFVIITPCSSTPKRNVEKIKFFWESLGSNSVMLTPEVHDRIMALTSHLPHFLVYSLLNSLCGSGDKDLLPKCVGNGFLDTTRIGASDSHLWAEIFMLNRYNLLYWIDVFEKSLSELKDCLRSGSQETLCLKIKEAQKLREWFNEERKEIESS